MLAPLVAVLDVIVAEIFVLDAVDALDGVVVVVGMGVVTVQE